jgi:hypothetical protein
VSDGNDVVGMVPPATGAREIDILDPSNPDVTLPVALYQAEKFDARGVKAAEPAVLFRFQPTLEQRGKILQGEDLYLIMLLPNGRAPLSIELTVGPGDYQLEPRSSLLGAHGQPLRGPGPQLWTPEQGLPEG